jgi:hypothetical protein
MDLVVLQGLVRVQVPVLVLYKAMEMSMGWYVYDDYYSQKMYCYWLFHLLIKV